MHKGDANCFAAAVVVSSDKSRVVMRWQCRAHTAIIVTIEGEGFSSIMSLDQL